MSHLTPARILETATAFWPAKVLLSAVELGLFTELASRPRDNEGLARALEIRPDRSADFFDSLVAMGFLNREGDGATAVYSNTAETDLFLDRNKPSYTGGLPEMLNARLFGFWNGLTDALRTGRAQNETKGGGEGIFAALYADEARLEQFLSAMASLQTGNFNVLASRFDFSSRESVVDVGGGERRALPHPGVVAPAPLPFELRSAGGFAHRPARDRQGRARVPHRGALWRFFRRSAAPGRRDRHGEHPPTTGTRTGSGGSSRRPTPPFRPGARSSPSRT